MGRQITINGIEYTILVQFTSENTQKEYIIYSTLEPDDGEIDLYSGVLEGDRVEQVKTPEEIEMIEKMIATITTIPQEEYKLKK